MPTRQGWDAQPSADSNPGDAHQDLVLLAHDAIAQELATAAIYGELLDDTAVAQSVKRQIERARERMRLLLRDLHAGERPEPVMQSEPAVVADLLTDFARTGPSVNFELSYVMDAPFMPRQAVREALFIFMREALQDIAARAPGEALRILVAYQEGTLRCELSHVIEGELALPGAAERAAAVGGALEHTPGCDVLVVPPSDS